MVLLDRYLHAVANHLPARNREDIITELREDLRAAFDERAQELGRPLTEDEQAAILKPYGRPLLMAARYWPQRYVIGPHVFPFYLTTLKLALAVALVVHVAVVLGRLIAGRPLADAATSLFNFPDAAIHVAMWVTLAFAVFDFAVGHVKVGENWDPRKLPRESTVVPRVSRLQVGFELVIGTLFIVWWIALPQWPQLLIGPGAEFLALGPIWLRLYAPVLALAILSLIVKSVVLVRPDWVTLRFIAGLLSGAASLAILATALRAGGFLLPRVATVESDALARALNAGLGISGVIAMLIIAITTVVEARRFVKVRAQSRERQRIEAVQ